MDILTLKPYQRKLCKRMDSFVEFYINDKSLSEIIDNYDKSSDSFLENYTGVLGGLNNPLSEAIKIKQLLGKKVSDVEIRALFSHSSAKDSIDYLVSLCYDELADPAIIIYGCAECGDYNCGGVKVTIEKEEDVVKWMVVDEPLMPVFTFNKHVYYEVFSSRLKKLQGH